MSSRSVLCLCVWVAMIGCLGLVRSQLVENLYDFDTVCNDTTYGEVYAVFTDMTSPIHCSMKCTRDAVCASFVYNGVDNTCSLNNGTLDVDPGVCNAYAQYAVKRVSMSCYDGNPCTRAVDGVRLCDGGGIGVCNATQGRIEILINGIWGTICDDLWNDMDYYYEYDYYYDYTWMNKGFDNANVVCRMFGFTSGTPRTDGYFPEGSGPIWLDGVMCDGVETSLHDCRSPVPGNENCAHFEDVGVTCA